MNPKLPRGIHVALLASLLLAAAPVLARDAGTPTPSSSAPEAAITARWKARADEGFKKLSVIPKMQEALKPGDAKKREWLDRQLNVETAYSLKAVDAEQGTLIRKQANHDVVSILLPLTKPGTEAVEIIFLYKEGKHVGTVLASLPESWTLLTRVEAPGKQILMNGRGGGYMIDISDPYSIQAM
ncbi:hypothetical protein NR798_12230 [Archangium gephyra]|uniref:hypothetical protein n=1 Tax=Archangium gephyra TaxID=48 RepID=UPI0035D50F8D